MKPGRLKVSVIGAGKVGAVLGAALRAAEHDVVAVTAVSEASRERAETLLPQVPVLPVDEAVRAAELVLFAVPDDALAPLVAGLAEGGHIRAGQILVHTSGRQGISVFEPARGLGAVGVAVHPVMTFTGMSLDLARLQDAAFGVTADPVFLPIAQALAVEMGGEPVLIDEEDRPLYHAALAHASNHLTTIAGQSAALLARAGVEDPSRMLRPLMLASLENALAAGEDALTGPVARGDEDTLEVHVRALEALVDSDPGAEDLLGAYRELAVATARRALQAGRLRAETASRIIRRLTLGPVKEDQS
ncbi:Rossmann-like and DUF2520 domain-containing protein [Falsarthrobacter nasiphocae]|uniref:Short-subunit dehydrogenase-like oxidoreductase (DUF2520 family) n=1 Tax=Falsarthrobacter nasiphocae TaxID=189863 RepID=A0AAE3YGY6_9MICC|nr:DUF2520 domain-containing protein [Falsarthrobacter nasiphocae]MDR6891980.1 putative short-subunit dehydrogenase-like oxidoreductase (DUF2520 family) [Falsarthrobacter nasiphocae]